ncbi:hypothetical protein M3181_16825 [Mesobacillus maritimus]|uniref:hypothetical protein n=1 Tax=Mesobacillus maritimus TaxID=1643336 RepID=UPI00203BA9C5|nr:hypothetical protein [Mesobacillus maritimus]MCM3670629.1 hypothetical protein [Mesobacillus maritimus]
MIWLIILIPLFIIGGIAVYFEKRTGMTPPESTDKQLDKLAEIKAQQRKDMGGGNNSGYN